MSPLKAHQSLFERFKEMGRVRTHVRPPPPIRGNKKGNPVGIKKKSNWSLR